MVSQVFAWVYCLICMDFNPWQESLSNIAHHLCNTVNILKSFSCDLNSRYLRIECMSATEVLVKIAMKQAHGLLIRTNKVPNCNEIVSGGFAHMDIAKMVGLAARHIKLMGVLDVVICRIITGSFL